jgi:hypothetical protein
VLEALEATAVATWLRHSTIAYPVVSALHIMAVGTLFGAALLMDLRLLGALRRLPVDVVVETLAPAAAWALAAAVATGVLLFSVSATDYVWNPAFRLKAAALALALANVAIVRLTGGWARFRRSGETAPALAGQALASLVCWSAVLLAGRFIGFV